MASFLASSLEHKWYTYSYFQRLLPAGINFHDAGLECWLYVYIFMYLVYTRVLSPKSKASLHIFMVRHSMLDFFFVFIWSGTRLRFFFLILKNEYVDSKSVWDYVTVASRFLRKIWIHITFCPTTCASIEFCFYSIQYPFSIIADMGRPECSHHYHLFDFWCS